jgi:hypothetical protein
MLFIWKTLFLLLVPWGNFWPEEGVPEHNSKMPWCSTR